VLLVDATVIELIRSMGYGALLGAGVTGLIYSIFWTYFSPVLSLKDVLFVGALLGGGAHRLVDSLLYSMLRPITSFIGYYSRLAQLLILRETGIISHRQADELLRQLTNRYFLGQQTRGDPPGLPPP
jgi:hypothetical protein